MVNLIVDLADPRFDAQVVHHAIEAFDRDGIRIEREHRVPERVLAWVDAEFGGAWSTEIARGGAWFAHDASGLVGVAAYDARGLRYNWLRPWVSQPDVGFFGPIGIGPAVRRRGLGKTLLHAAMISLRERGYRRALIAASGDMRLMDWCAHITGARAFEAIDRDRGGRRWRTTILASGSGSNFAAVVRAAVAGELPLAVRAVIANRASAYVLDRAAAAGIEARLCLWDRSGETRAAYDARLAVEVGTTDPELVLLLGFMHVLPASFVGHFECLNLHPAYLPIDPTADTVTVPDGTTMPAFRGTYPIDHALAGGLAWVGASVHRAGPDVDRGPILARAPLRREPGETRDALVTRVHALEQKVVTAAIRRWIWEQP